MKSQPWRVDSCGMTLIEMLVALAVFAVLGVMGYRAASAAMDSQVRVASELQRWRNIANLVQLLETDFAQYLQPPGLMAAPAASLFQLQSGDNVLNFSFLKLDGSGGNVRRRGYRFENGRILQLRWPGTDPASLPETHVVIENVSAMRCTLWATDGRRFTNWPNSEAPRNLQLTAVDIEMDTPDAGTIRRLLALR